MPGVSGVYIESSYSGHKSAPGKYTVTIKAGSKTISTSAAILANPLYNTDAVTYKEYDAVMSGMEKELTGMHRLINTIYEKQGQLQALLANLPAGEKFALLKKEGQTLLERMKAWDEEMIQRKSKAYDNVENFPNKFTANYMFLINQTESDIPRVNKPSLDRLQELNAEWASLETRATEILDKNIPALNKLLWEAGIGAIWKN